jgi:hypothetical protein
VHCLVDWYEEICLALCIQFVWNFMYNAPRGRISEAI